MSVSTQSPFNQSGYFDVDYGAASFNFSFGDLPEVQMNVAYVVALIVEVVIGVPANVSLIYLVARVRELRTAPNLLLANLAIGDVIFLLESIPVSLSIQFRTFEVSLSLCRFQHGVFYVSFAVSALSLTVISLERYGAIVKPFTLRSVRESGNTVVICAIIWLISILLFGIYPVYVTEEGWDTCSVPYHRWDFKAFFLLQLVIVYLLPVFCMSIFYAFCTYELLRKRRILGKRSTGRGNSDRSRTRVAFNLMLITFMFTACWLPNYIYHLWFLFASLSSFGSPVFMHLRVVKSVLYYMASCVNPMILYAMSTSFRHHLIATLTCTEKVGGRQRNGYVARDAQRSVTMKSTIRMQEPSTSNSVM